MMGLNMRKKAIVGRLQYSNELNTVFIDDIALHPGFKVYLKDSVALGKKTWNEYMLDYAVDSKEWCLCGKNKDIHKLIGRIAKLYL